MAGARLSLSAPAVQRHHRRAAQAQIVLQGAVDLPRAGVAAQLLRELEALREAGRAQRMALGEQAAGRIGDVTAAVGVVAVGDEPLGAALRAQAQRLVADELVVREAVVQFDDVDLVGADAGRGVDLGGGRLGQVVIACAAMRTAGDSPCRRAKASETRIAAAAPQVGGQAISRVITPGISTGDASTSSTETSLRNSASGLCTAWRLALARIRANVSSRVPYFFMCEIPAPPK